MSKWFLYQQDSALLRQSPQVSEDETETGDEVADSQEPPLAAGCLYPPTGKALEDVIVNQLASKKIPAAIHRPDKEDLRPIYTVRLCRIRQAYDRPKT